MRYGGSQQSPEKFIIFHAPTKNDRSHGRFLLPSRALPGDCHATLAMTEYFVRNRIRVCLLERNIKNLHAFFIILRATHFMSFWGVAATTWESPGREPYYKPHARYFVLAWRKGAHKQKTSIIACNNVISKAKCAPYGRVSAFCFPLSRLLLLFFTLLSIWHSCHIYDRP